MKTLVTLVGITTLILTLAGCPAPLGTPSEPSAGQISVALIYPTNPDSYFDLFVGETHTPSVSFIPTDATNQGLTYTSDTPSVATVDAFGVVTGVAEGDADITVTSEDGGHTVVFDVRVRNFVQIVGIDSVDLFDNPIEVGDYIGYYVTTDPWDASSDYILSSSNESVAIIEEGFWIVGVGAGTSTITVVAVDDPTLTASTVVTVIADSTPPELDGMNLLDDQSLLLTFSEPMQESSVEGTSTYTFSSGPAGLEAHPTAVEVVGPFAVTLSLNQPIAVGEGFTISMNVSDASGNAATITQDFVSYARPATPDSSKIVVSGGFMFGTPGAALPGPSGEPVSIVFLHPASIAFGTETLTAVQLVNPDGSFDPMLDNTDYLPMVIPFGEYDLYSIDYNDVFSLPARITVP
jgi:hypothetical protein